MSSMLTNPCLISLALGITPTYNAYPMVKIEWNLFIPDAATTLSPSK